MIYKTVIAQLDRRGSFRIKPGLERMRRVLRQLRNPERGLRAIHVAGTNGKGSVAASLESVLRSAGYRTGLYISPHLIDPTERIRVNGRPISERVFAETAGKLFRAETQAGCRLTHFEFMTAMAFVAFAREK